MGQQVRLVYLFSGEYQPKARSRAAVGAVKEEVKPLCMRTKPHIRQSRRDRG